MGRIHSVEVSTPTHREIRMTREFDAPRDLVWEAWTTPELVQRWLLGPDGWSFPVCEMDLRVGGAYRWVWRKEKNGTEMSMGGVYREIVPPERLVSTERFDDPWYEGECLVTTTFSEQGGITTVTTDMLFDTQQIRDSVLKTGMETGVERSYQRLDEMLPALLAAHRGALSAKRHPTKPSCRRSRSRRRRGPAARRRRGRAAAPAAAVVAGCR
jgi:uncharacterized protein YndB with AHSA1/START domain